MTVRETIDILTKIEDKTLEVTTYQHFNGEASFVNEIAVLPRDVFNRHRLPSVQHNDKDLFVLFR